MSFTETIDIHTHGIGGFDTSTTIAGDILKIAEIHGSHGVSKILPTIYPASVEQMRVHIMTVKRAMDLQSQKSDNSTFVTGHSTLRAGSHGAARIIGLHLEGPFLNPSRCGVLDPLPFLNPTVYNLKKLTEGFEDMIKIITIAPELDGAVKLIKEITDLGIIVSMGHSDATYEEAQAGFHAGAKGITHIFNAMRGFHHREPGIAGFGLTNPHVYIEIISDPYHLHPETIKLIFKGKNPEKIMIISDAIKDTFKIEHSKLNIQPQSIADSDGTLKGGSMTVVESARRLVDLGYEENIVINCISKNPGMYLRVR
jgi:N-acetylglucosamine-6-phosphate deacetylase